MRRCVKCNKVFDDNILYCTDDGELVLLGATLKDSYLIEDKLGEGGMAMVFRATNIRTNTPCAIKIIRPDLVESEINAMERLLFEALKLTKINHHNIVKVSDFGPIDGSELVYLTMELLNGKTLKQEIVEKGPLNFKKAAVIIEQISAGLNAAHEKGIVHRDIKPENIILLGDIKNNVSLKIIDFGISSDSKQNHFWSKQIIGTPEYMSPEQCSGNRVLDARSDIYNLGITVYEMLTGTVPFPLTLWKPYEVIRKQSFEDPEPLKTFRPDIAPNVEKVVMMALEKNRDKRHSSVLDFAQEFSWALRDEKQIVDNTTAMKFDIKDLISTCINQGLAHLEHKEFNFAINCFKEVIDYDEQNVTAYFNCGVAYNALNKFDEAIKYFNQVFTINEKHWESYFHRGNAYFEKEKYQLAINDYNEALKLNPHNTDTLNRRGMAYINLDEINYAILDFSHAINLDASCSQAYFGRGNAYGHKNDYQSAINDLNRAIELDDQYVKAYMARGSIYQDKKEFELALADLDQALNLDAQYAKAYFSRGQIYYEKKDFNRAVHDFNKAQELNLDQRELNIYLGLSYNATKQFDKAIQTFSNILDDKINDKQREATSTYQVFTKDLDVISGYLYRGIAYLNNREFDKAIDDLELVTNIKPKHTEAFCYLGKCYLNKSELTEALNKFTHAISLDSNYIEAYYLRGLTYRKMTNLEKAKEDFLTTLKFNSEHALAYFNLGMIAQFNNSIDEAINYYTQSILFDSNYAEAYVLRASAYKINNYFDKAIADCNKAIQLDINNVQAFSVRSTIYQAKANLDLEMVDKLKTNPDSRVIDTLMMMVLGESIQIDVGT